MTKSMLMLCMLVNFLSIVAFYVFDESNFKKIKVTKKQRYISFFLSKNILFLMNIYLFIYFLVLIYYFCIVVENYSMLIIFKIYIFSLSFFMDFWIIFFLFINFLMFTCLIYYFYFYQKILDYSLVDFKVLNYILLINIFMFMSMISNNIGIVYLCMNCVQMYFYKFLFFLNTIKNCYDMSKKKLNSSLYSLFMVILGDILMVCSLLFMLYFYGNLDFMALKFDLFSEKTDKLAVTLVFYKGQLDEWKVSFYLTSMIYFMLMLGIFFKSIYFYFWKYYVMLQNLNTNVFLMSMLYSMLMIISNCLFLYKCEKLFDSFSLYSQMLNQLVNKYSDYSYSFMEYNTLFDFMFIDLLIVMWSISMFFLIYGWFTSNKKF